MLVRTRAGTEGAAEHVAELFGAWTGEHALAGLLLVTVQVPHRLYGTRRVDGVAFTPHGLTVLQIKELLQRQTGVLHSPPGGAWTVDDQPALFRTQAQANPVEQLDTDRYAVGDALDARGVTPEHVAGLVVIRPEHTGDLRVRNPRLGRDTTVLLANHRDLRRYFQPRGRGRARRRPSWSADTVLAACAALGVYDDLPSREELLSEGFPPGAAAPAATLRTPRAARTRYTEPAPDPREGGDRQHEGAEQEDAADEGAAEDPTGPPGEELSDPPTPPAGLPPAPEATNPQLAPVFAQEVDTGEARRLRWRHWLPGAVAIVVAVVLAVLLATWMQSIFH